jgi:hypothetical protein
VIDRNLLAEVCEGNDSTADLCAELLEVYPEAEVDELADHFADRLRGFYDPDNGQTEDEHWELNREWGEGIFEQYFDELEDDE